MRKLTTEEFIAKAKLVRGEKYDYSKVNYNGNHSQIIIICPIHGEFVQLSYSHLAGHGCRKCYDKNRTILTEKFINKVRIIHGNKYDYSKVNYIHSRKKIIITCPIHGDFYQFASAHLEGNGCGKCYWENHQLSTEEFVKRASEVHKNYYNYSCTVYRHPKSKIKIICPHHGNFYQLPFGHLSGQGCKKCTSNISHKETLFLDFMKITEENRQQKIFRFLVDAIDISTKTIYKFLGDYWHGNPEIHNKNDINKCTKCTFENLYNFTFNYKFKYLKENGYNIKYIWENDWDKWKKGIIKIFPLRSY